jgi:hypothetical protein
MGSLTLCYRVLPPLAGLLFITITGLLEYNRYRDRCGGNFNDSHGIWEDNKYYCWKGPANSSQGSSAGALFSGLKRSLSFWSFMCLIYVIVIILQWTTVIYRIVIRRRSETSNGSSLDGYRLGVGAESLDIHMAKMHRECWIVFACTVLVVILECIEFTKSVVCKRSPLETAFRALGAVTYINQGTD